MINLALVKLLAGACAVLIVVITVEWWYWGRAVGEAAMPSIDYQELRFPQFKGDEHDPGTYNDLVNRPLFIEGRRAVPEPDPEQSPMQMGSETLDWELTGIYTFQQQHHVLLRRVKPLPDQKNHKKMSLNEEVDGWRLVEILVDKAILERGAERQELILRKPKQKEPSPGRRPSSVPPRRSPPAAPKSPASP